MTWDSVLILTSCGLGGREPLHALQELHREVSVKLFKFVLSMAPAYQETNVSQILT